MHASPWGARYYGRVLPTEPDRIYLSLGPSWDAAEAFSIGLVLQESLPRPIEAFLMSCEKARAPPVRAQVNSGQIRATAAAMASRDSSIRHNLRPLSDRLEAFAYRNGIEKDQRFFQMNRQRVWQIVKRAALVAGIDKQVYPHLLRHSDAVERARQIRHPKALQEHFGWSSPYMVMKYLSTLQQEDALRINQEVKFDQ